MNNDVGLIITLVLSAILGFIMVVVCMAEGKKTEKRVIAGIVALLAFTCLTIAAWGQTRGVPRPNIQAGTYQVLARAEASTTQAFDSVTRRDPKDRWQILVLKGPNKYSGTACYRFRADLVQVLPTDGEERFEVRRGSFAMRMILYVHVDAPALSSTETHHTTPVKEVPPNTVIHEPPKTSH